MPRKKRTIVEETIPDESIINQQDFQLQGDEALDELVDTYGSSNRIKVYRINQTGRDSFCFETNDRISESYIQNRYPQGGRFRAQIYNGNTNIKIGPAIEYAIEPVPLTTPTTNGNGNGHNPINIEAVQIQMMQQNMQFYQQMLLTMIQNMNNGNQNQPNLTEMITALNGLNGLTQGKSGIDLIMKGMELGAKANGKSDWKSDLMDTVKEVAVPAIEAYTVSQKISRPQQLSGEQPVQIPPSFIIQQGLKWLKTRITGGMPTLDAARWLAINGNDPQYQPFVVLAMQEGIEGFIKLDPEIANEPYKSWFTETIELLKEIYENARNADPDNDGGIGDNSDSSNDENVSVGKPKLTKAV